MTVCGFLKDGRCELAGIIGNAPPPEVHPSACEFCQKEGFGADGMTKPVASLVSGCGKKIPSVVARLSDAGAPREGRPDRQPPSLDCAHRGKILRTAKCKPCQGSRLVNVYECTQHGECTLHQHLVKRSGGAGRVKSCAACPLVGSPPTDKTKPCHPDWTALQDVWRGGGLFLIAGGPSIRTTDLDQLGQRGLMTMAVNQVAATHVRPDIWVTVDPPGHFHELAWRDPRIIKLCRFDRMNSELRRATDRWKDNGGRFFDPTGITPRSLPNTYIFRPGGMGSEVGDFLTSPEIPWCVTTPTSPRRKRETRSVMLAALSLAYRLGFRRVYLVGTDFKMDTARPYAFDQQKDQTACEFNNNSYGALGAVFQKLEAEQFRPNGFRVFNCTPGSELHAFEHLDLEDAVARELAYTGADRYADGADVREHYIS